MIHADGDLTPLQLIVELTPRVGDRDPTPISLAVNMQSGKEFSELAFLGAGDGGGELWKDIFTTVTGLGGIQVFSPR